MKTSTWCNHMKKVAYIFACSEHFDVSNNRTNSKQSTKHTGAHCSPKHKFLMLIPTLQCFSAHAADWVYLGVAVYSQNIESMMAHTNFYKQQEKILLHCSDIGNTAAKTPTYSLNSLNCFAVLESEEKLLHQAISESLLSVTGLEKKACQAGVPPKLNDKAVLLGTEYLMS